MLSTLLSSYSYSTACNNTIVIVANTINSHMYCPYRVISIIPTFLSSTPLSYVWPIHYYLNRFHFYDPHTLHPYLIFVQLLPGLLANMTRIISIFASYLLHSYIISTPFHIFAICATLIIFIFSSHRLPFHSNFLPSNNLKDTKVCLNLF